MRVSIWACVAAAAAFAAVVGAGSGLMGGGGAERSSAGAHAQERPVCLSDIAAGAALDVSLVSAAPSPLCEPVFRTVELRNRSGAPLGAARLELVVSDREDETPFLPIDPRAEPPVFFQMSADDGATWVAVEPPITVDGRLVWTVEEAPLLARLGPNSAPDDSVLLRWRSPIGEVHGGPFAPDAAIGVAGEAVDACNAVARSAYRETLIGALQPELSGRLVGRNATRGGGFAETVPAAPGDVIEWRLELDNAGAAAGRGLTAAILTSEGPLLGAERADAGAVDGFAETGVLALEPAAPGGLSTALFRAEAPASCGRQPIIAEVAFGCGAPTPGRMASIRADAATARAWVVTAPDLTGITITPSVSGEAGAAAPGAEAQIRVVVANDGPPAFAPRLEIAPPDGYEIPLDAVVEFRATTGRSPGRLTSAVLEPGEGERRILRFIAEDGATPVFSAGERLEVNVTAQRARRTLSDSDVVAAALLYRDGCGQEGRTPAARARTPLRQAELTATPEPVGGPVLRLDDGVKSFTARITNVGDAQAETVSLAIEPGPAWRASPPAGCVRESSGPPEPLRFVCLFEEPLEPGGALSRRFDLLLGDAETVESAPNGLRVTVVAEARAADAAGAPTGSALARAAADSSVVGFAISQRLTTEGGELLDPADAIDLGQRVGVELEARWIGVGADRIEDAALALYLPPQLGFIAAEQTEGDIELVGVRVPALGGSGRVLWSLGSVEEGAETAFRVDAAVVDATGRLTRDDASTSISRGAVEADAIFSVDGRAFGVDAAELGPTRAEPLELIFRRPDLRIGLAFVGAEAFETSQAGGGLERWSAPPGQPVVVEATLSNLGAGPGYFDWIRIEAPPGVEILPFDMDGVDNDDDGRIDEPDESATAYLGPADERLGGSVPIEARWSGAGGGALGGAERLIRPNGERVWRAALRLAPDAPPDRVYSLRVEAQFGAQPTPRAGGESRTRVRAEPLFGTAPIEGWFVLTETSVGRDLDDVVATGETAQHRLTLRLPPGRLEQGVITVDFDRAYQAPDRLDARFGAGLTCSGPSAGAASAQPAGGWRAVWELGECVAATDAPPEARLIIIDVGAAVIDADPGLAAEDRTAWRRPRVVGAISYLDPTAEGGRAEVTLGETSLTISGPAPRLAIEAPERVDGAEAAAFDAGDRFEGLLRLVNAGDKPTSGAIARYGWPDPEIAPIGFDCAALEIETSETGARVERVGPCLVEARLDFSEDPLEPGDVVELRLVGGLTDAAPMAGAVETPISVVAAAADAPALDAWSVSPETPRASTYWRIPVRGLPAPELEVARGDRPAAIGDAVLARGRFVLPESVGPVALLLRFRYEGRAGPAARGPDPVVGVSALTLSRSREDLVTSVDPSRINVAAPESVVALRDAGYEVFVDAEGWTVIAAPLGEVAFDAPTSEPGEGVFTLELAVELFDAPAASRGRRLMAEAALVAGDLAALRDGGAAPLRRSEALVAVELAEPFLDLAALHEDADGSAQLGERVVYIGRACNRGRARAYGAVVTADLPDGFALDPNQAPSFVFDDGPEALGPRPYGVVTIEADGRLVAAGEPATPIEPGACVALMVPSFAEEPAVAAPGPDGVFTAPAATARFEIASYRGRPSEADPGRRYGGLGPSSASVLRRDLVIDAPSVAYLDPDGWIRHPFTIRRVGRLRGDARLSLILSDTDELAWTIFLDLDRDGQIGVADRVWRDGAALPAVGELAFVARARPAAAPPIGWRRTALLRAAAVTPDGRLFTGAREIVAARGSQRDGVMRAERLMAVDRDCDGRLEDEAAQDAAFEKAKDVALGECVIMRVTFRNDGVASVERVEIEDVVPTGAQYLEGTATFASTPTGLVGRGIELPTAAEGGRARLRFSFVGALAPGLEGVVEYRVRITG